jgi:dTDP-4-amino-4,6-dideoxygalactose transaminase
VSEIRFLTPELPPLEEVAKYFALSEEARWFANGGPCHVLLTRRIEEYVGRGARCVLVANGTLGLMIALRALVTPTRGRDEVIIPAFTFAATANAVLWAGLKPVFVDVDARHWHLAPEALDEALAERGDRVAAVLPCSTFGVPPASDVRRAWEDLARRAGVPVLVDSASGFGAVDEDGNRLGLQGDAELFSFHATKPFAIGEGGALVTAAPDLADDLLRLTNFGFDRGRSVDDARLVGLNAKLSELTAATGLAMLDRYEAVLRARCARAEAIRAPLEAAGLVFQEGAERSAWQFVPVLAPTPAARDAVLRQAVDDGIELRTYFEPLQEFGGFAHLPRVGDLAVTADLGSRILSLPLANDMSEQAIAAVVRCTLAAAVARA